MFVYNPANSHDLDVTDLVLRSNGTSVTGATVTVTVVDEDGNEVSSVNNTWPETFVESSGDYSVTIESDLVVTEGAYIFFEITVSSTKDAFWRIPCLVTARRYTEG